MTDNPVKQKVNDTVAGELQDDNGTELFAIIDETGEGWGFDLNPETMARPIAIATGSLFGLGMLAGIPAGIAVGRSQVGKDSKAGPVKPTMAGVLFATRAFLYGTLLCSAFGVAGFYGLKWYYDADTFEQFGARMRSAVPKRRQEMETGLGPVVSFIRSQASNSLPGPIQKVRERFQNSRAGVWMRSHFEADATSDRSTDTNKQPEKSVRGAD